MLSPRPEERLIEEARYALLVRTRTRLEAAHVTCLGDLPELFRGEGGAEVVEVELLPAATATRVNEEDRTRGDARDEIREGGWRTSAAQEGDGARMDGGLGPTFDRVHQPSAVR